MVVDMDPVIMILVTKIQKYKKAKRQKGKKAKSQKDKKTKTLKDKNTKKTKRLQDKKTKTKWLSDSRTLHGFTWIHLSNIFITSFKLGYFIDSA